MTDEAVFRILDRLEGAPRLTVARQRFYFLEPLGGAPALVVVWRQVGAGQRWAWSPRDLYRADRPAPIWFPLEARHWLELAQRMDFYAHARAQGARML